MIKTPLSTMIGGAGIWTTGCTVLGGQQNLDQLIKSLFSDGTQGIYLNAQDALSVSDLSSIKDLSGNNNHALQANSTSRASLITDASGYKSLKFDGIDDGYVTQSIDFSNTDKVTVIAAVRKLSDAASGILVELSSNAQAGSFYISTPHAVNSRNYALYSRGSVLHYSAALAPANYLAPISNVIGAKASISVDSQVLRIDGKQVAQSLADQGTGNYGNYPLYIGRRGGISLPFNGQIYALLVIGKLLDDATTQRIEKEFAKYVGVTL